MAQVNRLKEEKRDRTRRTRKPDGGKAAWRGFVNYSLTAGDKEALKSGVVEYADAWDGVLDLVMRGYKASITYDDKNSSWVFSMTCQTTEEVNAGLTLSGRGGTLDGAVCSLWYRHENVMGGDWTKYVERQQEMWKADDFG